MNFLPLKYLHVHSKTRGSHTCLQIIYLTHDLPSQTGFVDISYPPGKLWFPYVHKLGISIATKSTCNNSFFNGRSEHLLAFSFTIIT